MIDRSIHWIKSAAIKDDYLYCVNRKYSILFRINLCSWEPEKIAVLEWDKKDTVTDVYEIDGQIVCIPLNGIQVAVYDPKSGRIKYDKLESDILEVIDIVISDHKIWFVPRCLPGKLYYYSLKEARFMEEYRWEEAAGQVGLSGRIKRKSYIEHNQMYLINGKKIAKYDFESHCMTEIDNPLNKSCADIVRAGDTYYCITEDDNGKVFYWNVKGGQVFWQESAENNRYVKLTKAGKVIFLDAVNKIDLLADGEIKKWEDSDTDGLEGANYISVVKYSDKWILLPWGSTAFIECSSDFTGIKKYEVKVPAEDILEREKFFSEAEVSLDEYTAHITRKEKKAYCNHEEKSNGQVIYDGFKQ